MNECIISVVVCTYNRAPILKNCLDSLSRQYLNKSLFEVIIVDNNSNDSTQDVVNHFTANNLNFSGIIERTQGLSCARNRGFQEAVGQYIAYIDDDACAHNDWLQKMASFIERNPEISAFGGPYYRFSFKEIPHWFPENYGTHCLTPIEKCIDIQNERITGSNMVFRKKLLEDSGGFLTSLGMNGSLIRYGEETEFLLRIDCLGEQIWYVPEMKVDHLLAEYKISLKWLLKSAYRQGTADILVNGKKKPLLFYLLNLLITACRSLKALNFLSNHPYKQNIYIHLRPLFLSAGRFVGYIKYKLSTG